MTQKPFFQLVSVFTFSVISANSLQLAPLLSTCVDACQRGCMEIRNVQKSRDDSSKIFEVELKDGEDPRSALTEADFAAQKAIVGALRQEWGLELCIVGEEDGCGELNKAISSSSFEPLKKDMFEDDIGETAEIDPSEITIYVDPLDGTREFVKERLENCQVLVGIAIGGESVAGAIGYVLFQKVWCS
jgi:fructose-1,6-bisphosphatase/inositol monophosphatase family enzyme